MKREFRSAESLHDSAVLNREGRNWTGAKAGQPLHLKAGIPKNWVSAKFLLAIQWYCVSSAPGNLSRGEKTRSWVWN